VRDQVELYESTDGLEGNTFRGRPVIIVTMRGARSGALRKVPLMRVERAGRYAVLAANGGDERHPTWYRNIVAHPSVVVQDGGHRSQMSARELTGEERQTWWERAVRDYPPYAEYQTLTSRIIPVVLLEPINEPQG
jgi:deazaflavin-dependent oxidoreductase (nitroreductase family)